MLRCTGQSDGAVLLGFETRPAQYCSALRRLERYGRLNAATGALNLSFGSGSSAPGTFGLALLAMLGIVRESSFVEKLLLPR